MSWLDDNAQTALDPRPAPNAELVGPADADNFRVKVGRFGTRWYTDPLPACDLADASDWQGPSVSATKPPFANKYVPMRTIADMPSDEWTRLAGVTAEDRYEALKAADKASGRVNMRRGTLVHLWAEDLLAGRPMRPLTGEEPAVVEQTKQFAAPIAAFFDAHQPEAVAVETVCLHRSLNGVGYGGTADAFLKIDGDLWAVDWKSRTSSHGAYLEEAAQGGAYCGAEYMIVADDAGGAKRAPVPKVTGVLIVSITADGFRCFPIEADKAVRTYQAMHAWWAAQRQFTDNKVIGKPWAPKAPMTPTEPAEIVDLRTRIAALIEAGHRDDMAKRWPQGVPTLASGEPLTADQLATLDAAVSKVEALHEMPFTIRRDPEPPRPIPARVIVPSPDDGGEVSAADLDAIKTRFARLPKDRLDELAVVTSEARDAGTPLSVTAKPCVRRWEIARALVLWAESGTDIDALFAIAVGVATPEQTADPDRSLGGLLGLFTIEQARSLCEALTTPGEGSTDEADAA